MIIALLSSKQIDEESLKRIISKKLDLINNVQISIDKKGNIILYPTDFPKSIVSLLSVLSMADFVLFLAGSEIGALDAELVIAVENSGIINGAVIKNEYSDMNSFNTFFGKYKINNFEKVDLGGDYNAKEMSDKREFKYVSIDKHFIVKGIGSVIIGFVIGQQIKKGEKLFLLPSLKQCSIKSIQIMDVDNDSAEQGSHVGLALNNVSENDLSNNYAVSSLNDVNDVYSIVLNMSSFYKEDVFSKQLSCSFLGETLSISLSKKEGGLSVKFNKKIPHVKGKYIVADASLSIGKNRIVGNIEII